MSLAGQTVALALTGSIAAYKAVEVARLLLAEGARVLPLMTRSAERFVGKTTLSGICGEPTLTDMWDSSFPGEMHVQIADKASLILIAPATADILARMAHGRADDLVTALALCAKSPVLVAPAMHSRMWLHPATQRNVKALQGDGIRFVGPVDGPLASGESGIGRMAAPSEIVAAAASALAVRDLEGLRLVITAGPTLEDFDPVRFLGNRSTGRMGFAIAERAAARGADVTLIAGPVNLTSPPDVKRVDVRTALQMRDALASALGPDLSAADALIMSAAVADYRPVEMASEKIKKRGEMIGLELTKNPDLLAEIGNRRKGKEPILVGFALETGSTEQVIAYARRKLAEKSVDFIVANHASDALGTTTNLATLVSQGDDEALSSMKKSELADTILDRVRALRSRL